MEVYQYYSDIGFVPFIYFAGKRSETSEFAQDLARIKKHTMVETDKRGFPRWRVAIDFLNYGLMQQFPILAKEDDDKFVIKIIEVWGIQDWKGGWKSMFRSTCLLEMTQKEAISVFGNIVVGTQSFQIGPAKGNKAFQLTCSHAFTYHRNKLTIDNRLEINVSIADAINAMKFVGPAHPYNTRNNPYQFEK